MSTQPLHKTDTAGDPPPGGPLGVVPENPPDGPDGLAPPVDGWFAVPRALLNAHIGPTAFRVYCALVDHAGRSETAYPGLATLAHDTRSSPRSVDRAVAELVAAGLITRTRRGLCRTNLYQLHSRASTTHARRRMRQNGASGSTHFDASGSTQNGASGSTQNGALTTIEGNKNQNEQQQAAPPAAPSPAVVVASRLRSAGVHPATARRLVATYGVEACDQQADWLPLRKPRDPGATLRRAIEEHWLAPGGDPDIRLPGERAPQPLPPPPALGPLPGPEADQAREAARAALASRRLVAPANPLAHFRERLAAIGRLSPLTIGSGQDQGPG